MMTDYRQELKELAEQLWTLAERASQLPHEAERHAAFEEIGRYQARLDAFAGRARTR